MGVGVYERELREDGDAGARTLEQLVALRRRDCQLRPDAGADAADSHNYNNYTSTSATELAVGRWCPREFDGWTCVEATPANSVALLPCPRFVLGFDPKRQGQRVCLEDGTWFRHPASNKTWSNYTTCVDIDDLQLRTLVNSIYKTGYTISLAALLISILIFFYFKSLSCTRIQIHKNLFASLALNNCLWLVWYEAVVDNLPVLLENRLECQALHVLVQYSLVATYMWMFCEGLYLHTLLVVTFVTVPEARVMPMLCAIGWGAPAAVVALYAALRGFAATPDERVHCWIHESSYSWALSGPVCASMLANLVFLVNIVRLLVNKLHPAAGAASPKHGHGPQHRSSFRDSIMLASSLRTRRKASTVSGADQPGSGGRTQKAVRATLILIPLLGLQYVVMPFRPEKGAAWEPAYQVASAVIASCQGLCVALLFCFCNGEVIAAVSKRWKRCRLKKRSCHSCTGVTSVSFSRSSFAQEMMPVGPNEQRGGDTAGGGGDCRSGGGRGGACSPSHTASNVQL